MGLQPGISVATPSLSWRAWRLRRETFLSWQAASFLSVNSNHRLRLAQSIRAKWGLFLPCRSKVWWSPATKRRSPESFMPQKAYHPCVPGSGLPLRVATGCDLEARWPKHWPTLLCYWASPETRGVQLRHCQSPECVGRGVAERPRLFLPCQPNGAGGGWFGEEQSRPHDR